MYLDQSSEWWAAEVPDIDVVELSVEMILCIEMILCSWLQNKLCCSWVAALQTFQLHANDLVTMNF